MADIRAVGPDVWNNWKATLLRGLYFHAEEELSGGVSTEPRRTRIAPALAALRRALPDWDDETFARHSAEAPPYYWLSADTAALARQARLAPVARDTTPPLEWHRLRQGKDVYVLVDFGGTRILTKTNRSQ